jgi:hypothetical protein
MRTTVRGLAAHRPGPVSSKMPLTTASLILNLFLNRSGVKGFLHHFF